MVTRSRKLFDDLAENADWLCHSTKPRVRKIRARVLLCGALAIVFFTFLLTWILWPTRDPLLLLREDAQHFADTAQLLDAPDYYSTWEASRPLTEQEILSGVLWAERLTTQALSRLGERLIREVGGCIAPVLYGKNLRWLSATPPPDVQGASGVVHMINPRRIDVSEARTWYKEQSRDWMDSLVTFTDDMERRSKKMSKVTERYRMFSELDRKSIVQSQRPNSVWIRYVDPVLSMQRSKPVEMVVELRGIESHSAQSMLRWLDGNAPYTRSEWDNRGRVREEL